VTFVPALSGLGAPYWDQGARGTIVGLTRGTTRAHIARATLEGIAFSVYDLLEAMVKDAGHRGDSPGTDGVELSQLRVDGGAAKNDLLMYFQADIARARIERPFDVESTGRGAAMLAGVGLGLFTRDAARGLLKIERAFEPKMSTSDRDAHLARWRDAVARARTSH
jgi:glycerol kinase